MVEEKLPHHIEQEIVETTISHKKAFSYVKSLIDDPVFNRAIIKIRKKYKLPQLGLCETLYGITGGGVKFVEFPKRLTKTRFSDDVEKLSENFGLDFMWSQMIENYVVYNNINISILTEPMTILDVKNCFFGDYSGKYGKDLANGIQDYLKETAKDKPVALFINPYASQREILDYIKKFYKLKIKPIQDDYRNPDVKFGKIRSKKDKIQARNRFIYDYQNLPKKELMQSVSEHFHEVLDYAHIAKIISLENIKRRSI